jgi:diacylglycerol kinase family enzyme
MGNSGNTIIIWNPAAGEGKARRRWQNLQNQLEAARFPYEAIQTEYPGHATEIAATLLERDYSRIGVFGGDGTFNEVLQGIFQEDKIPRDDLHLIYLPAGSSCDFEKKFDVRRSYLEKLTDGEERVIDAVKVVCHDFNGETRTRYFINNSSVGVISLANEKFNNVRGFAKIAKRVSVDFGAVSAGLKAIFEFEPLAGTIAFEDETFPDFAFTNLTIFKTPYFGGGMYYGVETVQDDGLLSVAWVDAVSRWKLIRMIPALYAGTIFNNPAAHYRTCTRVRLETEREFYIETDGQLAGTPPATYTILQQAVKVLV